MKAKIGLRLVCSTIFLAAVLASIAMLSGCASSAKPAPTDDMTPAEFFQWAQDAAEKGDYTLALRYYEQFQLKYPDDSSHQAWAAYEIAVLYHKMGNNTKAIDLLDQLLDRYAKGEALPDAPLILAEKVKTRLVAALPKKPAAAPQAAPAQEPPAPAPQSP
jgi:outer membrane protein assembly factor BamD (BamD/ComL family)